MNGVVGGGWNFVWAAYAVSAIVLGGYALSVIRGFRAAMKKEQS
jgi:heme exporter protein CcmD